MNITTIRTILWLHTLLAGAAGAALYLFPAAAGSFWPWPLPALAARFVGALLLSAAIDTGLTAAARDELPVVGALLMGLVLYGLIDLTGVLALGTLGASNGLLAWIALVGALALGSGGLLATRVDAPLDRSHARPQSRFLRGLLWLDFALVAPVGLLMYLAPEIAQRFWPWNLTPINVRLIGSIFVATAALSLWALRQSTWEEVRPSVVAGGTFATLALIASFVHFNLFDPSRL
ncbi:MAG TPA: hypothetical protein VFO07_13870, partial [Roseiflexaceae bacterium]|nr:hypothetical protein [Roseiflexaceae bacterium]